MQRYELSVELNKWTKSFIDSVRRGGFNRYPSVAAEPATGCGLVDINIKGEENG
jgi:hypothetical protein